MKSCARAVAPNGFSDRRSRPFRINVVITPAVRERTDATSSSYRQNPYAAAVMMRSVLRGPRKSPEMLSTIAETA
jgi:hypothetical protein